MMSVLIWIQTVWHSDTFSEKYFRNKLILWRKLAADNKNMKKFPVCEVLKPIKLIMKKCVRDCDLAYSASETRKNIAVFAEAWKVLEYTGLSWKSPLNWNLPWKVLENHSKALKSFWTLLFSVELSTVDRVLNLYKIVAPLFGAAYAAPNIGTTILY